MNDRAQLPAQNFSLLEAGFPILNLILGIGALICVIVLFVCFWSTIIWAIVESTREVGPGQQRSFKKTRSSLIVGLCACAVFIVSLGLLLASMYFLGQYWS